MLKGVPEVISPDLLYILASMGHGDTIAIVDEYYPAKTMNDGGRLVYTKGLDAKTIIEAVTSIMPLDLDFCDCPVRYMVSDDYDESTKEMLPVHKEIINLLAKSNIKSTSIKPIKRNDYYKKAKTSFATISTSETSAFGCFILQKGLR